MNKDENKILIHMADDDEDDRLMFQEALEEARLSNEMSFSVDGQDLLDYLRREGKYQDLEGKRLPDLILLDLNMPRVDGHQALKEIKSDPKLRRIPIVILTTSSAEKDILSTYDIGANSFISKPVSFEGLVEVIKSVTNYWFNVVRLPED